MAIMDVHNDSAGWLVLWLEPLGEDRWLKPGETFRVRCDSGGDDPPFTVDRFADDDDRAAGIEHIAVCINQGDAEVTDSTGAPLESGHHRPEEITRKWAALFQQLHQQHSVEPDPGGMRRRSFYAGVHTVTERSPNRRP